MVFEALQRHGSRAERVLFYPAEWDTSVESESDRVSQLLVMAKDMYNVQTVPIDIQMIKAGSGVYQPSHGTRPPSPGIN